MKKTIASEMTVYFDREVEEISEGIIKGAVAQLIPLAGDCLADKK